MRTVCLTDVQLPLRILAGSLQLALLEIMHAHERTTEVYDPRDPDTGAAFSFPDVDDLQDHYKGEIQTKQKEYIAMERRLDELKLKISLESKGLKGSRCDEMATEMTDLQIQMMRKDGQLRKEIVVAETASAIQLSVMWVNKWSMDFPDNYLRELSGIDDIADDGLEAYCAVNWIEVK